MAGEDVSTWDELKARLADRPRGAGYKLSELLGMNSSYFYRKLKQGGPLKATQANIIRQYLADDTGMDDGAPSAATQNRRRLPVFGYAAAGGDDRIATNEGRILDWMDLPMGMELGPGEWFVVVTVGSSMEPRIFPGEPQIVRRDHPPSRGKDVVVEFADGTAVIKTYKGQRDGKVFVEQYNPPRELSYDATSVRALHGGIIRL